MNHRASGESDITLRSSQSSSDNDTSGELHVKNSIHPSADESLSLRSQEPEYECQQPKWERLGNSADPASTDNSSRTPSENFARLDSDVESDILIQNLKSEISFLSRQTEMSELELQTLRKQVLKESKRGEDLSREIYCLKEENDALSEGANIRVCQRNLNGENTNTTINVEELRQELNHVKELNASLNIQLQKTQESNSDLILAVGELEDMLKQKNEEMPKLSERSLTLVLTDKKSCELDSSLEIDDEEQKALEELIKEHSGAKEEHLVEQQLTELHGEIEIYKRGKDELEMQMEQLSLDYEILKQENHEMAYKLEQSQLQEQLKIQYECSSSYATAYELEQKIENLKGEMKRKSQQFSDSLARINELEALTKSLEEALENQAQGFEADIESLTRSKLEQEQRTMRAEETLAKTRSLNADTAERIQEDFKRLSMQMAATFEANEKVATKALAEAKEFRLQKSHLEDTIRNISEELNSVKRYYDDRLQQISSELVLKSNQITQMQSEIEKKRGQLEEQKAQARETESLHCNEILTLKNGLEQMKSSTQEMQLLIQKWNDERAKLESSVALLQNEAYESQKDLNSTRCLLEEKEALVGNVQLELKSLQSHYDELKHYLSEDSSEKDKLKKQVLQLKSELKKREDVLRSVEKKLKDDNGRGTTFDRAKTISKPGKSTTLPLPNKEIANLKQRVKMLEGQILLKETALEKSSNVFLKKETDLHNKIKEMEKKLEVLNEGKDGFFENEVEKVVDTVEDLVPNEKLIIESRNDKEIPYPTPMALILPQDDCDMLSKNRYDSKLLNVLKDSSFNSGDRKNVKEITYLKERNNALEEELKEMQGRYTEISLKFAEVESERQHLIMRQRNLMNARNSS